MIDPSRPVRVFRNWKRGCYNILQGRFLVSAREVCLGDVEFLVRASGRRRMLESGRKNVHAYAVGSLIDFVPMSEPGRMDDSAAEGRALHYNPFAGDRFVDSETLAPLESAPKAFFVEAGATYSVAEPVDQGSFDDISEAA